MSATTQTFNPRSEIKWNHYLATAYTEGFCEGEGASLSQQIEAWAYLINSGLAWSLQGSFGRTAKNLIERGLIEKEGAINWDEVECLEIEEN